MSDCIEETVEIVIEFLDCGSDNDSVMVKCFGESCPIGTNSPTDYSSDVVEETMLGSLIKLRLDERLVETFSNAAAFLQRKLNESRKLEKESIARETIKSYLRYRSDTDLADIAEIDNVMKCMNGNSAIDECLTEEKK